jgi:hypothetical protein
MPHQSAYQKQLASCLSHHTCCNSNSGASLCSVHCTHLGFSPVHAMQQAITATCRPRIQFSSLHTLSVPPVHAMLSIAACSHKSAANSPKPHPCRVAQDQHPFTMQHPFSSSQLDIAAAQCYERENMFGTRNITCMCAAMLMAMQICFLANVNGGLTQQPWLGCRIKRPALETLQRRSGCAAAAAHLRRSAG